MKIWLCFFVLLATCCASPGWAENCPKKMEYKGEQACVSSDVPDIFYGRYKYPSPGQKAELILGRDGKGYMWFDSIEYKKNFEWGVLFKNGVIEKTTISWANTVPTMVIVMHFDNGSYSADYLYDFMNTKTGKRDIYVGMQFGHE